MAKKQKKHKKSILQQEKYCYLCDLLAHKYMVRGLQEHHIFGGPNRSISEAEGLKCWLCLEHHTHGPEAVHNNIRNARILQQEAQQAYERTHTREEFVRLIGRNFMVT